MNTGRMNVYFQRQFNMAVKLLGNILCWYQIIEDALLIDLAVNQILNRYLMTSVRTLQPLEAILKITMVRLMLLKYIIEILLIFYLFADCSCVTKFVVILWKYCA